MSVSLPSEEIKSETLQLTPYHAQYFACELTKRCASNTLEKLTASLSDAQVDLNPHQVEAALFAFKSPLSKGAVLADEVGLGKTIEAGLVIAQKWAELKRKILIIVPANLRNQWHQELLEKFFISSRILETKSFQQEIKSGNLNPFIQNEIVICSYPFAKSKETYIQQVPWDLVVIDEAHRLRNVYKPTNKIGNAIKNAVSHAPKILLTATPLQNSLLELYGLISLIDDHTFGDLKSYKSQFSRLTSDHSFDDLKERLKPICKRTLRRQVLEYIKYTNRVLIRQDFEPSTEEDRLYNLVSDYLQSPKLFALPASQRQLMTLILRKLLASSTYAISETLEQLAVKLEGAIQVHAGNPPKEAGKNLSPKVETPDISGNYEGYDELLEEWAESEEVPDSPESPEEVEVRYTLEDLQDMAKEADSLKEFAKLAGSIHENSKGKVLLKALDQGFAKLEALGARQKAILFTESTRTQAYLKRILEREGKYKGRIVLFNGVNADAESQAIYKNWLKKYQGTDKVSDSKTADIRAALVDYFKDEATVMIATEAAAEGINLQFCSLVVNYDLPWNPQRIEQRIGRCHRYGQKYDVVVINFLNKKNAADIRVHELLEQKFQLFDGVFGASDEVLGGIESGVDFEKRILKILQTCRTEMEIQASFDALQQELESQIDENLKITRQKLFENFDEAVHEKLRLHHAQSKEYLGKYEQWLWNITRYFLKENARFDLDENAFLLVNNPFPDEKIPSGPYRMGKAMEATDESLPGGGQGEISTGYAHIYRIGHPLAKRIIQSCKQARLEPAQLVFDYTHTPKKITILEECVGESGWLTAILLTIHSFEPEDHVILSGVTDTGRILEKEQCYRLFSLPADVLPLASDPDAAMAGVLRDNYHDFEATLIADNLKRNSVFFDEEMEKLDKWAEDLKSSLELELKELDKTIKAQKTETKKILNLDEKVQAQRRIKDLEKKRNKMRLELYQAQDDVDTRKEDLITRIEARLKQRIETTPLFRIRWQVI